MSLLTELSPAYLQQQVLDLPLVCATRTLSKASAFLRLRHANARTSSIRSFSSQVRPQNIVNKASSCLAATLRAGLGDKFRSLVVRGEDLLVQGRSVLVLQLDRATPNPAEPT